MGDGHADSLPAVSDIPPEVARRAVQWQLDLQSPTADDAVRRAHQEWLALHPDHQRAWARIQAVNQRLRGLAGASSAVQAALVPAHPAPRRRVIRALGAAFLTAGAAWQVQRQRPWRAWLADERTGVGERRTLALADGSILALNTDTAVELSWGAAERRVRIIRGEVLVTTGADTGRAGGARSFVVQTAHGELKPLGTRFAVRHQAESTRVDVFEGAVAVLPRNVADSGRATPPVFILHAGQQVRFTGEAIGVRHRASEADVAWVDGMLVASGMRLDDFLAELGRHRPGHLSCDEAVAHLRVSGTYPLDDTERVLDLLTAVLPVAIHRFTRWWVTVAPRPRKFSGRP